VAPLAALLFAALVIMWAGRGLIFYLDEWAFITGRLGGSVDTYLRPHNEHLMAFPVAAFKALFVTVGIGDYWPYRLAVALGHLACVALLFAIARRRVGFVFAGVLTAPVLAFGPAWEVLLFPVNLAFVGSTAAGLGMLLALDRRDRRGDLAAGALLLFALASSSVGVALVIGAAVEILWRRDRWRRVWVAVVPALLYGPWYASYNRHPDRLGPLEPGQAPMFAFRMAANAVTSLLGVPLGHATLRRSVGPALDGAAYGALVAAVAVLAWVLRVKRRLTPRMAMLLTTLGSYWLLTGVARAYTHEPYGSRYIYPAAVLIVVVVAEAAQGAAFRNRVLAAVALISCGATALNLAWLIRFGDIRRGEARVLAAELTALESARGEVLPDLQLDRERAPDIRAGPYFHAIDVLGSSPAPVPGAARAGTRALAGGSRLDPPQVHGTARPVYARGASAPREGGPAAGGSPTRERPRCSARPPARRLSACEGAVGRHDDAQLSPPSTGRDPAGRRTSRGAAAARRARLLRPRLPAYTGRRDRLRSTRCRPLDQAVAGRDLRVGSLPALLSATHEPAGRRTAATTSYATRPCIVRSTWKQRQNQV
jgi:hypothetical protein